MELELIVQHKYDTKSLETLDFTMLQVLKEIIIAKQKSHSPRGCGICFLLYSIVFLENIC